MDLTDSATDFRHALCDLGSVFGRLAYFSGRRDEAGIYHHPGLGSSLTEQEAHLIIRSAHEEAFAEWLNLNLEAERADLELYLSDFDRPRKRAVTHYWATIEPHRTVIPERVTEAERNLYLADFEALLALLAAEYGEPE